MTEVEIALLAALGGIALAMPGVVLLWRRAGLAQQRAEEAAEEAEIGREILAAAPDGLFLWDHASGRARCSRRLAVLLGLEAGTQASFADVAARFDGDAALLLETAVEALRRVGATFELMLPSGERMVHAVGARAATGDGRPLADLLWMRDASAAASAGRDDAATEGQLQALLDALPVGVWLRDSALDVVLANRAGGEASAAAGSLARRARDEARAVSESHLAAGESGRRLVEITEAPLAGWPGTIGFAVERPVVDAAAKEPAANQVLENLRTAVAVFGPNMRLGFFNSAFAQLWGADPVWLRSGPTMGALLDALRSQRRLPEVADFRAFRSEQLGLFGTLEAARESWLHLPDGRTLRSVIAPHFEGGLVVIYEDMSDRLLLERKYNTLIAVQRATLDNLYEGVAVFGSDGRLKLHNPSFARLWSGAASEGEIAAEIHITEFAERMRAFTDLGEADWPAHKARVIARLMDRRPSTGRLVRSDGSVLDYANVPLPDGAMLLSYIDITDTIRVEQALRQRAEALQEADRLKSEFIANVSYEVRTPLNTVIGFAGILTDNYFGDLNRRQEEYARGILETSQHLMRVIDDILDLATIEAGMMKLELDTVDLHAMLVNVLALVRERARRKSLDVGFECPTDIGWLVADERRLKQVVFNLLSNAVAFTPARGTVSLAAERSANQIVITITDTGIGIPKAEQAQVFEAFKRGPSLETGSGGTGLGLSLVKRFVELHGGEVAIRSRPNQGTTVTCALPTSERRTQPPVRRAEGEERRRRV